MKSPIAAKAECDHEDNYCINYEWDLYRCRECGEVVAWE